MFGWFKKDPTARKKEVKRWIKEHEKLRRQLEAIEEAYRAQDGQRLKKLLVEFEVAVVEHLLSEDSVFYEIQRSLKPDDPMHAETEKMIRSFRESFSGAKGFVVKFLSEYTKPDARYDATFKKRLDEIVEALNERMLFEETQYYAVINH